MEKAHMLVLHASVIGITTHLFLHYVLGDEYELSASRSVLLAALILVYMVLFGCKIPTALNKNLFNK
jgi:hypothetical protein